MPFDRPVAKTLAASLFTCESPELLSVFHSSLCAG